MPTARELIKSTLRKLGAIGRAESVNNEEASDHLETLNQMLDSWSQEGLLIFTETEESFSLVAGQASYTIGSGGNFNTTRPVNIRAMTIRKNNIDYPLKALSMEEYAYYSNKSNQVDIPSHYYYDMAYPTGNIIIVQTPSEANTLKLFSEKPLTTLSGLTTSVSVPPGHERAMIYNLGMDIAPEYGIIPSQRFQDIALESKENVIKANMRNETNRASVDAALVGSGRLYNIYSDV